MRKFVLVAACLYMLTAPAQSDSLKAKLDDLRTPSFPAFSILGVQPTEISRPNSWRALQSTLTNSFLENNKFVVPKNFAMEVNPFFATQDVKPENSPAYVFGNHREDNLLTILKFTSAISVATGEFPSYHDTAMRNPRMGIGYRTSLITMKPTDKAVEVFKGFKGSQLVVTEMLTILNRVKKDTAAFRDHDALYKAVRNYTDTLFKDHVNTLGLNTKDDVTALVEGDLAQIIRDARTNKKTTAETYAEMRAYVLGLTESEAYLKSIDNVKDAAQEKWGSSLELATAFLLDFPTNDIAFSKLSKFGFWATYTYRSKNQHWEFGALARYSSSKFDTLSRYNNFDFGGRIMLEGDKWNINGELVQRFQWEIIPGAQPATPGQNTLTLQYASDFKMSLNVGYRLTDDIIVSYTFGNNFSVNTEFETAGAGKIFSTAGLVYAFGGPRIKDVAGR